MAPTFSIIIPVYNVAPYLAECLDSVRAQTYADWEALCVDDGSTDASAPLLDTYARLDSRIHVTHQRNAGVSSARNRALNTAHGDWIWFVDADDAIHPQALGTLQEVVQEKGTKFDAIGIKHLDGSQLPMRWAPLSVDYKDFTEPTMQSLWHFWGAAWRTLFSRSFLSNRRFRFYRMGEDLLFSVSSFVEMEHWILADAQCYFYRAREGSAMRSLPQVEVLKDWLDVQEKLIHLLLDSGFLHKVGGGQRLICKTLGWIAVLYRQQKPLQIAIVRNECVLWSVVRLSQSLWLLLGMAVAQTNSNFDFADLSFALARSGTYLLAMGVSPEVSLVLAYFRYQFDVREVAV